MNKDQLSPELQLLCSAVLTDGLEKGISKSFFSKVDLTELHNLAKMHQVRSLLYDFLAANKLNHFQNIMDELKFHHTQEAVFNMLFMKKSVTIYQDFQNEGLNVFLMKGALWAWMFYKSPSLREFGDIDYFFAEKDIVKGLAILEKHGYIMDDYRKFLIHDSKLAHDYFKTDYQLPLEPVHEDVVKSLEVQWNASYPRFDYQFSWDELMFESISFNLAGNIIQIPRIENQLLLMIVHHAGVEQWGKLKYIADFIRLLRNYSSKLDWIYIIRVSQEKGFYQLLLESLGLIKWLTDESYFHLLSLNENVSQNYPNPKFLHHIIHSWEHIKTRPMTKSWDILSFNMKYRDSNKHRLSILQNHIAYAMNFKLMLKKAKWYYSTSIK